MDNSANIDIKKLLLKICEEPLIYKYLHILVEKESRDVSTSKIQRDLKVGYVRASRITNILDELEIIQPFQGSKPRLLLVDLNFLLERITLENNEQNLLMEEAKDSLKLFSENKTESIASNSFFIEKEELNREIFELKQKNLELENENNTLKEKVAYFDKYQLTIEKGKYKAEQLEYKNDLKVKENEMIINSLINNQDIIENLQKQYEETYNTTQQELDLLRQNLKNQKQTLSFFNLKHFQYARNIVLSTKQFISLLEEVDSGRTPFLTSKIDSLMKEELLMITEEALNGLIPLCGDTINEKDLTDFAFILRRFQHFTNKYLEKVQMVFINRGLVPPRNSVLDQINTLVTYRESNGIPAYYLTLLYYLALVLLIVSEYEQVEGVGPEFIVQRDKRRIEDSYASLDQITKGKFPTLESYIKNKLANYSQQGKLPENLYINKYAQYEVCILDKEVANKFIYDESILETINNFTLFYICGNRRSGIYKFGVTRDDDSSSRIKAHSKTAKRFGIEKMDSLIELKTPHALTIENYFKDKFKHYAERLNYAGFGSEWLELNTSEEVEYIINGVWESDSRLRYILSYTIDLD